MAASATSLEYVQKMYIAYFGRPAAPTGQEYYGQLVDAGKIAALQDDFWNSAESQALFNQPTTEGKVNAIFNQLFGRDAKTAGLTYWTVEINSGRVSLPTAALTILNSAAGADKAVFDAKMDVANAFTAELDTTSEVLAYQSNTAGGRTTLAAIETQAAADAAVANVTSIVAVVVAGGSSETDTFALTNGTDIKTAHVFTAGQVYTPGGDDRINSLQDEDQLTGTDLLTDRLDATLGNANDNGATIITPKLTGIEIINTAFTGSGYGAVTALDLQDATGQTEVNITRISQAVNAAEVGNIMTAASKLSLANTNANLTGVAEFSYGAGVLAGLNEGTMSVTNVQIGALNVGQNTSTIVGFGVGVNGFETLNLTSAGAAANTIGTLNMPMDTGTAGKLVITGAANLTLGQKGNVVNTGNNALIEAKDVWVAGTGIAQAGGRIATVDASAFTGNLSIVLDNILDVGKADTSGVPQDVTIKGGSGADTFVLYDVVQAGDSIEGGDGADSLLFYSGSALNSVVTNVEAGSMLADGSIGDIALDYDFLPNATSMTVRNISSDVDVANFGGDGVLEDQADGPVVFSLTDMSAAQAAAISIQHSTTGNGQIFSTTIEAAVKANTANDLLSVTIAEGTNVDPVFNFSIDTRAANTATAPTAGASRMESLTLTDADSESNSVQLNDFADFTGTITLTGGVAGTYISLDVDTAGADVTNVTTGVTADGGQTQQGLLGLDTDGSAVNFVAGNFFDATNLATQVRLGAATVNASAEVGNVIVRVSTNVASVTGAQSVTTGSGNDVVIFDLLNDARAGLTISDTVDGGTGSDKLAIDGHGVIVSLGASEWTNVKNFETIQLVGNGVNAAGVTLLGQNSYNLVLTNDLINANGTDMIAIISDNDISNDAASGVDTATTGQERGVTLDARTLDASNHFSFNGEEGVTQQVDKFIFADANINGGNIIDGGAVNNVVLGAAVANADVLEIRNAATATVGDLANLKNIGILAGTNDQATAQTLTLELNDTVIDSLVDSFHVSSAAEVETLTLRVNNAADITAAVATVNLDLDISALTSKSGLTVDFYGAANLAAYATGMDKVALGTAGTNVVIDEFQTTADAAGYAVAGGAHDELVLSLSKFSLLNGSVVGNALGVGDFTTSAVAVDANTFAGGNEIIFDETTGTVFYNTNGAAAGGLVALVTLTGVADLALADFTIIG